MSLIGGLNMYGGFGERYQSDDSAEGRKVVYLQKNGFDHHQEYANKFFKKDDILTVKEIYVGRSSSEVEFVEHPGKKFNTVMFADLMVGDSNIKFDTSILATINKGERVINMEETKSLLMNKNNTSNFRAER